MSIYKLETELFGEIEVTQNDFYTDIDGSIIHYKSYKLVLNEKEQSVNLCLFNVFTDDNIKTIEDMLNHIPQMYEMGKKAIFDGRDSDETIKEFIDFHLEELDSVNEAFGFDSNDKMSSEMLIEQLELRSIAIHMDDDNTPDCALDFMVPEGYTDELLVVYFNSHQEICNITNES